MTAFQFFLEHFEFIFGVLLTGTFVFKLTRNKSHITQSKERGDEINMDKRILTLEITAPKAVLKLLDDGKLSTLDVLTLLVTVDSVRMFDKTGQTKRSEEDLPYPESVNYTNEGDK